MIALDVQNAFVNALLAKENLALAQGDLRSLNQIVQVNKARVDAGNLQQVELRRTRLATLQLQTDALQAQMGAACGERKIAIADGTRIPAADFDIIDEPRRNPPPASLDEVERLAFNLRPDLQALRRDQARSQAEIRLQLAQGKVDYMVGVGYLRQQGTADRGNALQVQLHRSATDLQPQRGRDRTRAAGAAADRGARQRSGSRNT